VSNLNLYRLGRSKDLGQCMVATKFEPHDNWLPPCYHVSRELEQALIMSGVPASHWNMADLPDLKELDCEQVRLKVLFDFIKLFFCITNCFLSGKKAN